MIKKTSLWKGETGKENRCLDMELRPLEFRGKKKRSFFDISNNRLDNYSVGIEFLSFWCIKEREGGRGGRWKIYEVLVQDTLLHIFDIAEYFYIRSIFSSKLIKNLLENAPFYVYNFNPCVCLSIIACYFIKIPTWENKIWVYFSNTCCFIFYYTDTCEHICKNMYIKMSEGVASVLSPQIPNICNSALWIFKRFKNDWHFNALKKRYEAFLSQAELVSNCCDICSNILI